MGLVFAALSFFNFVAVLSVYKSSYETTSQIFTVLVACAFCVVLVVAFAIMSFLLLLTKSIGRGRAGFVYGFLTSSAANLALIVLLCSLAMISFVDETKKFEDSDLEDMKWGSNNSILFQTSSWLGVVGALGYLAFFVLMLLSARSIHDPAVQAVASRDVEENLVG